MVAFESVAKLLLFLHFAAATVMCGAVVHLAPYGHSGGQLCCTLRVGGVGSGRASRPACGDLKVSARTP